MTLFFLVIAAGFLTILAPCILPILPIILGTGATGSRTRPYFIIIGFILAFSVIGAVITIAHTFLGIRQETLRVISIVLLGIFGLALIFEPLYEKLTARMNAKFAAAGAAVSRPAMGKTGILSGLLIGLALGLIWTPCAGPILGTIITLAVTEGDFITTMLLFMAYAIGAGIPMLIITLGSRWFFTKLQSLSRHTRIINIIFGILILLTAAAIHLGYDRAIQANLIQYYPSMLLQL